MNTLRKKLALASSILSFAAGTAIADEMKSVAFVPEIYPRSISRFIHHIAACPQAQTKSSQDGKILMGDYGNPAATPRGGLPCAED